MTERIQDRLRAFSYEEENNSTWWEVKPEICAEAADHIHAQDKRIAELEGDLTNMHDEKCRLAREIDFALCGDGAAEQASLCDLVGVAEAVRKERDTLAARCAELEAALRDILDQPSVKSAENEVLAKGRWAWKNARAALAKQEQTDERD